MAANTPWCPRCGAWRGYIAKLCKGCVIIEEGITADMIAERKQAEVAALQAVEGVDPAAVEKLQAQPDGFFRTLILRDLVQMRFVKISEMRTDREAYTQSLESMVEKNIEVLKGVCYDWMRMRPESRRVRFSNMFAAEMIETSRMLAEELGAVSLELTKYTENKAAHDERMQRILYAMGTIEKFINPDANDPEEPPKTEEAEDEASDKAPGQE